MDLYSFMDMVQTRLGLPMTQREKEQIVGTLKTAGYKNLESKEDTASALKVVTAILKKKQARLQKVASLRTAAVEGVSHQGNKFNELADLNKKGLCGKCKSPMETVRLSDSEEANYCTGCRVTLWK